ncbi:MAG: glutamine amidotransferase [Bradyrhizobiaceae bacterium]|nr:MAG: glutamine amidotransferase [Bradyrhizobiaceae bacterium]
MTESILIVLHQEHSTPGRLGQALRDRGYRLDIRRPPLGDPLPDTLAGHAGAVIFGGPMSANDEHDYVKREIAWTAVPLKEGKPLLGICLGGQMLARQLGARVAFHPEGKAEVGYYPIRATPSAEAFCGPWPEYVYQWHREGFDLPQGCELLAEGDTFAVQAFRTGNAFAIQFHAEVTHAMMCRWTIRGHERMSLPNAKPRAAHFADRPVYDYAIRNWLSGFVDSWLACGSPRRLAAAE